MFYSETADRGTHTEVYIYYNGTLLHKRWKDGIYYGREHSYTFGKYGKPLEYYE